MILTTNRVTVFDEAVQSRIHLGIKYDQLSKKAKAEIWTAFIQQANKVSTTGVGAKLSPKQLDDLSRKEFNGRQVRPSAAKYPPPALSSLSKNKNKRNILMLIQFSRPYADQKHRPHGPRFRNGQGHPAGLRAPPRGH